MKFFLFSYCVRQDVYQLETDKQNQDGGNYPKSVFYGVFGEQLFNIHFSSGVKSLSRKIGKGSVFIL